MTIKLSTAARNALGDAIVAQLDAGAGSGSIKIYDGTQPANPSVAVTTQNILSEHTLTEPAGTVTNGVLTFATISNDEFANATGTASWARFFDGSGAAVVDASISPVGGGGDLQMNTVNVVINGPVRFTSLAWTMPGG